MTTDAFPPPVLEDAVADLALRFAADHGVLVPERTGHRDRLADVWTTLSSAGITHPGLAFAGWATRTWLGGVFPTILANSPDVGALLDRLQRFHPLFGKQRLMLANDRHSTSVWLEATDGTPAHPDTIDAFFAILCWLTRHLTSNRAAPSRVVLRRPLRQTRPHIANSSAMSASVLTTTVAPSTPRPSAFPSSVPTPRSCLRSSPTPNGAWPNRAKHSRPASLTSSPPG